MKNFEEISLLDKIITTNKNLPLSNKNNKNKKNKGTNKSIIKQIDLFSNLFNTDKNKETIEKISLKEKAKDFSFISNIQEKLGGLKTRFKNNLEAIKLVKSLKKGIRKASFFEQNILAKYVGWGSMPNAFDENKEDWKNEYQELKEELTEEEYKSARDSVLNAHYTDSSTIKFIYKIIDKLGFKKGVILEPSCGIGNFFGNMPIEMKNNSEITGVELDNITGEIAKQLYPNINIQVTGFENSLTFENYYDLVVGNVPFGNYYVNDKKYDEDKLKIHNYFIIKSLDKVREGGLVVLITSMFTMDSLSKKHRKIINDKADLIGAIRLPNNTFKEYAKTEAVTDIIILKKKNSLVKSEGQKWQDILTKDNISMNEYFVNNPQMVLGKPTVNLNLYGSERLTIEPFEEKNIEDLKLIALENIPSDIYKACDRSFIERNIENCKNEFKEGSFEIINGKVFQKRNNQYKKLNINGKNIDRIERFINIRKQLHKVFKIQLENCSDNKLKDEQLILNNLYDDFVSKYGYIDSRSNKRHFKDDPDYFTLCALEINNGDEIVKSQVFFERTISKIKEITEVNTPQEALPIVINKYGKIDLQEICKLCNKTSEKVIDSLYGIAIFINPVTKEWELENKYLSGNIKEKLRIAKEKLSEDKRYLKNIEALEEVQLEFLTADKIEIKMGATWIPSNIYVEFICELLEIKDKKYIDIEYNSIDCKWTIENRIYISRALNIEKYGTERKTALELIEASLNLKQVIIKDKDSDGKYFTNKKETSYAISQQNNIKNIFENWIYSDINRREMLEQIYNEKFNSIVPTKYNGSFLTFPGMNKNIKLKKYQKDAVARCVFGDSQLLAHCVGAGKTFESICSSMTLKRLGIINKPLFVVPNVLVESGQFYKDFLYLYPNANILCATSEDFNKENRRRLIGKIANNNWDAIIIGHSSLKKIPISKERRIKYINKKINSTMEYIKMNNGKNSKNLARNRSVKDMVNLEKKLRKQLEELLEKPQRDEGITFEELGVDQLIIDESHNFKNLGLYTKMSRIAGVQTTNAQKTEDLFLKIQYIYELRGRDTGVIFLSGTPISNSMVELYTNQLYLQPNLLKKLGLYNFDEWAANFGEVVNAFEIDPTGKGYRVKQRFAKFFNVPELIKIFKISADILTEDMIDLPKPKLEGEKPIIEELKPSPNVKKFINSLVKRAKAVSSGLIDKSKDNMLCVTNDGRKAALDYRLIDPNAPEDENCKINVCADNVYKEWVNGKEEKLTQIVFCDVGTPKKNNQINNLNQQELIDLNCKFDVYNELKRKLIQKGIPEEEIAFIHDANTTLRKKELKQKFINGQIRILVGSTSKCGEGMNFQDLLIALHQLDVPWRPSDITQRFGRILRNGNKNKVVRIYNYVTKETFDSYNWQIIETKSRFINQVMKGNYTIRKISDIDEETLSYEEIKAIASGNPKILEKVKVDTRVNELQLLKGQFNSRKYNIQYKIRDSKQQIEYFKNKAENVKQDIACREEHYLDNFEFTLNNVVWTNKEEVGKEILKLFSMLELEKKITIGSYRGFDIQCQKGYYFSKLIKVIAIKGNNDYRVDIISKPSTVIERIDKVIDNLEEKLNKYNNNIFNNETDLLNYKKQIDEKFEHEDELKELIIRQSQLNSQLCLDKKEVIIED